MERTRRVTAQGAFQLAGAATIAVLAAAGAMQAPSAAESNAVAVLGRIEVAPSTAITPGPTDVVDGSTVAPRSTSAETTPTTAPESTVPDSTVPDSTVPDSTVPDSTVPEEATTTSIPSAATTTPTTAPATSQLPADRPAPTLIEATSTSRAVSDHERRGTAALARIDYDWSTRLPGWTIEFQPGRSGLIGLTYTSERRIEIYVRDGLDDALLTHVIAHELGHAIDLTLNTSADRERWQQARGIDGHPWWPGDGANDFATGAGDFAEAFAEWQTGAGHHRSRLGGPADAGQLQLLQELVSG